jgi:hypothetical protein
MHCVKCGTAVPEGAAFCPNCGAATSTSAPPRRAAEPEPEQKNKKLVGCLLIGLGIIVLLIIIGSFAPDAKDSAGNGTTPATAVGGEDATPAELPIAVTATELFNAYDNNEASAQSYFGGHKLLVSGTVDKVTLDFADDPVVGLRTPNQFMTAQAALADDAKDEAGNFNPGNKVKLLCEDVSEVVGTPMLKDCRAAPAGMKGQPVQWSDK